MPEYIYIFCTEVNRMYAFNLPMGNKLAKLYCESFAAKFGVGSYKLSKNLEECPKQNLRAKTYSCCSCL